MQECLGTLRSEDRSSMRLPPLNAVRVCAAAAVILTFVASPAGSQSNRSTQGEPVAACEKELARYLVTSLINSGFVTFTCSASDFSRTFLPTAFTRSLPCFICFGVLAETISEQEFHGVPTG